MGEAEGEVCVAELSERMMEIEKTTVAALECENKNVVGGTETELYSNQNAEEVLARTDIECFTNNQTCEILENIENTESLAERKKTDGLNSPGLEHRATDEVKEVSNDDMLSEVSNPKLSPMDHTSSFQTFSSQLVECPVSTQVVSAEITSSCSGAEESLGIEDPTSNEAFGPVTTSCVVLEIPKEFCSTGVRKIKLKFSKYEEDKNPFSNQAASPLTKEDSGELNNVQAWNPVEPSGMDVELNSSTTRELHLTGNTCLYSPSMELNMSKEVVSDIYPMNVKKLLSTKILDGARVKYISTSGQKQLSGIVKDSGYLCGCSCCNLSKVLSAYEFELHAGGKTRHPNNHIYLENGKPINSIIQELKITPFNHIDQMLKAVAGSSVNEQNLQMWKATLVQIRDAAGLNYSYHEKPSGIFHSTESQLTKDCTPARYSLYIDKAFMSQHNIRDMAEEQERVYKKSRSFTGSVKKQKKTSRGGTKKRDNDLHRLLFMPNGLPDGTDLAYYSKGKKILGGYKRGNGILCSCCHTEISPSQFEAHAGWSAKRQPYRHIYTSNGLTLHDIALMLASGQSIAANSSDDMCALCGIGGELVLCDACPQAFHAACLGLDCAPPSNWVCTHCQDKSGTGNNGRNASGESRPIIIRLTRVVRAPSYESGGCVVCRVPDFSPETFDDRTVMLCDQCEKEYHVGCLRKIGLCDLKELPTDKWFCCNECNTIYLALQSCVAKGSEVIQPSVSAALTKKHVEKGLSDGDSNDIQWRILSGKSRYAEHLPLLSKAAAIFRECFDPIVAKTGRDLIPVMVYGRNISGQEFGGMYCVVLMIKSVVVSAGLLRVFGKEVAELPLVATSKEYQGKGYFQALFACIEMLLHSMHVKNLVLPAAEEAESIWTKKLGFRKMTDERYLQYSRDIQLTIFKGTSMLEKEVQQASDV
ncbi:unnamed protein product [Cuscuta epithymum]|uniref:PHD-type domain-containing protein n=1 Tax=Cuscuta epithymum TaxID=186058 RepID=A0AAV0D1N3_9ASTE|nr:unnamed protein product [Cuscuta epithymum]